MAEALVPSAATARVAVDALERPPDRRDIELLHDLRVDLLVSAREVPEGLDGAVVQLRAGDEAVLVAGGRTRATWRRTHGAQPPGGDLGPVAVTSAARVGVIVGADGLAPEPARVLMLRGADLIVWFPGDDLEVAKVAATRAAENRVNLVVATRPGAATPSMVLDPAGTTLASAGAAARLINAVVSIAEARRKEMAPGTDVVSGRQAASYAPLAAAGPSVSSVGP